MIYLTKLSVAQTLSHPVVDDSLIMNSKGY
jgi:hypothetical protein